MQADNEIQSTEVTGEDLANAIEDEYGVKYSKDGKRLLKADSENLGDTYKIKDGTIAICDKAFAWQGFLRGVYIPNSVTSIGDSAFQECWSLSELRIPDGVASIGDHAFFCCHSLSEVYLPDSVTNIGVEAFWWYGTKRERHEFPNVDFPLSSNLEEIHIPAGTRTRFERMLPEELHSKIVEKSSFLDRMLRPLKKSR